MWRWVKLPKGIALIAFLLPWMTVSCSGTRIASATGFGLAFGSIDVALPRPEGQHGSINLWLIAAIAVIALGLVASLGRDPKGGRTVALTSAVALLLIWAGTSRYSTSALLHEAAQRRHNPIDETAAALIQVDWHIGYWLAVLALILACGMGWLTWSGRDRITAASSPPTPPPPSPEP